MRENREMDTNFDLSLIKASCLINITEAFKDSGFPIFPHVLFRDVLINEERIIKAILKK